MVNLMWAGLALGCFIALAYIYSSDWPTTVVWLLLLGFSVVFWYFAIYGVVAWLGVIR